MKRLIVTLFLIMTSALLFGQNKGDFYLSGFMTVDGGSYIKTLTYGNTTEIEKTPKDIQFLLVPKLGYFISDRFEINFSLGYALDKDHTSDATDEKLWNKVNRFVFGPGICYHIPLGEKFTYSPGLEIGFGVGKAIQESENEKYYLGKIFSMGLRLDLLAFEFRPTEHLGISLKAGALSYDLVQISKTEDEVKGKFSENTVSFGINYSPSIGFKYYF